MPLHIVRNDITRMNVDAIVNAANSALAAGGGVCGSIHRAAGPSLERECAALGGCPTGSAKITSAGDLPCKYVIHAVGPQWLDGKHGERELLVSCYRTALELARDHGCESAAFPLISSGIYGYPKDQALKVAIGAISDFLFENDMTVYLVIFDKRTFQISSKLFSDIAAYIDDHYAAEHTDSRREQLLRDLSFPLKGTADVFRADMASTPYASIPTGKVKSLEEAMKHIDESFSEMLLRKIDQRGMKDSQCYKKANIDRKLFSKIRTGKHYKPSKPTVIAFAIALELDLAETRELLLKAGFALSPSSEFDIIIEFFISQRRYDIFEINEALFAFDQSTLGA